MSIMSKPRGPYDLEQELIRDHIVPLPMKQRHPILLLLGDLERAWEHAAYERGYLAGKYARELAEELAREEVEQGWRTACVCGGDTCGDRASTITAIQ